MALVRPCTACREVLPDDAFLKRSNGHNIQPCRSCRSSAAKTAYYADVESHRAYARRWQTQWRTEHRAVATARSRKSARKWMDRNPERLRVIRAGMAAVARAIKNGVLVRPTSCERCGGPGPIEAAHSDYSQRLAVSWLCRPCHRMWDRREPKSGLTA